MIGKNRKARRAHSAAKKERLPAPIRRDGRGRVYLELHRDPISGSERLALIAPLFKEAWQNQIAVAAAKTAHDTLARALSLAHVVELARHAMTATSTLSDSLLSKAPLGAVACKAGCDHCCYQGVGVTPPEALAIFDHLKSTRSSSELALVAKNLKSSHNKTRQLSSSERFSRDHPCPFLSDGQCSIYEARPLSCRGMNSLNAESCATRLSDPLLRAKFLKEGQDGQTFLEPIRGFHAISAGLQVCLKELYYLDMRPLDLNAALHLLLNGSESTAAKWLSGLASFESALGAAGENNPLLHELSGSLGQE